MKVFKVILLLLISTTFINAQEFITTWSKPSSTTTIEFEATTTGPVAYTWETLPPAAADSGSGTFQGPDVVISGLPSTSDNISVLLKIQPQNFKRIKTSVGGFGVSFITEVNQWGNVAWESFENAFLITSPIGGCNLQVTATDVPDLSNVTSMKNMFAGCQSLNSPFNLNFWDISNVTDLSGMFKGCANFNQALSQWDTSNVTDMSGMFEGAISFNQNIGTWNTSNVTDMSKMFKGASSFNNNISNWDTSNVTDMSEMFFGNINSGFEYQFNQNISGWNTSNVTDMSGMFQGAINFNKDVGSWDTSNVTDMSNMFRLALSFDQDLGNWDTSNVTDMSEMFKSEEILFANDYPDNSAFNNGGSPTIENWDTSNATNFSEMFFRTANFNQDLGNWSLAQAQDLTDMLDDSGLDCNRYSSTLIGWNNNPTTPDNLLLGAELLNYNSDALPAINNLLFNKGWSISGHDIVSNIPEFDIDNTYCQSEPIPTLPSVSNDGIAGSWSPDFNSTQTTTYTFTPNPNECALDTSITISVLDGIDAPSGSSQQTVSTGATIADLSVTPSTAIWYADQQDALDAMNPLTSNFPLEDGETYYAVVDNGQCRSQPFGVTVTINLSIENNAFSALEYYPNPVTSSLHVYNDTPIDEIKIYNLSGKLVYTKKIDQTAINIDIIALASSIYIAKIRSGDQAQSFRIIKK